MALGTKAATVAAGKISTTNFIDSWKVKDEDVALH